MQIKCVVIDDEPLGVALVKEYISRFPELQLAGAFDDALAGADYLRHHPVDLLFIDIHMPDILGTDLVRSLQSRPMVIFTTAYRKFAVEGFELDAIDYLVKPIPLERFEHAVHKAKEYYSFRHAKNGGAGESLFVRSEYQLVRIDLDQIEYIESVEDYLKIHRTADKPIMTLMTLKAVMDKLPTDRFARIHRSYIVPLAKIRSVVNRKVRLTGVELPVSETYLHLVQNWRKK